MKIAIIGAGPAGLAVAYQLVKSGFEVDMYENQDRVGGFAKSIELWGRNVEIGPHFLNVGIVPQVNELVSEVLNENYSVYQRKTFIITNNKMFYYPPVVSDMVKKMRIDDLCKAAGTLLIQSFYKNKYVPTAEAFVKQRLGAHLYKYFFENFSKKLWGKDGSQVSDVFARSLLGFNNGYTPLKVIYTKLKQGFKTQVIEHKYVYPGNGLSTLWEAIKQQIENYGGNVYLSATIKAINADTDNKLSELTLSDGTTRYYDAFVSTVPILSFIKHLHRQGRAIEPAGTINYRNDVLVYLKVTFDEAVAGQCFYCYDNGTLITRITNFNEFTPGEKQAFSILLVEFWCDKHDDIWEADEQQLLKIVSEELSKTNVFKGLVIHDMKIKKVRDAFQIPDLDLVKNRDDLHAQLAAFSNLYLTGRTASVNFNYGMENAVDDGINVAAQLKHTLKAQPQTAAI